MVETDVILKEKLVQYLKSLEDAAKSAGDFAVSELPEVVKEFIQWEIAGNLIPVSYGVLLIIATVIVFAKTYKPICRESAQPVFIVFAAALIGGVMLCGHGIRGALKAYVAPRVVVLEKIIEMAK